MIVREANSHDLISHQKYLSLQASVDELKTNPSRLITATPNDSNSSSNLSGSFAPTYRSLDLWRGIAAVGVTIFHGFGSFAPEVSQLAPATQFFFQLSTVGAIGVHFFFVISGYCIAAYIWRNSTNVAWNTFLSDRFLRIYPTYWAACCVSILVNLASSYATGKTTDLLSNPTALLASVFLVEPYVGTNPLLLVSWTLVFEIGFYIVSAFALALRQSGVPKWVLLLLAVVAAFVSTLSKPLGVFYIFRCWPEFFFGLVLFFALSHWQRSKVLSLMAILLVPLLALSNYFGQSESERVNAVFLSAAFSIVLFVLNRWDQQISNLKQLHWLAFIGTFSYSLYLTHTFLGLKLVSISRRAIPVHSELVLAVVACGVIASILCGYAFYLVFEKRFESFRKRLANKPLRKPPLCTSGMQ